MKPALKLEIYSILFYALLLIILNIFTQACMLYYYPIIQIDENDFMLVEFAESAAIYFSMALLWAIFAWLSHRNDKPVE